ncbi:hypothetical protein AAC387_Pa02g4291 [Persea americana]
MVFIKTKCQSSWFLALATSPRDSNLRVTLNSESTSKIASLVTMELRIMAKGVAAGKVETHGRDASLGSGADDAPGILIRRKGADGANRIPNHVGQNRMKPRERFGSTGSYYMHGSIFEAFVGRYGLTPGIKQDELEKMPGLADF